MIPNERINILVVDDEPHIAELLRRIISSGGYSCAKASGGETAIQELQNGKEIHLIVTDIMMPGMSGVDLLKYVKALFPTTAVLMVTGVHDRNTAVTALELGAYGYVLKPFGSNEILINVAAALERRRVTLMSKQYEHMLEEKVRQRTYELRRREEEIVLRLLSASEHRDDETGAHVRRVGLFAAEMAKTVGWDRESVDNIRLAAPMHDIGKIGIPDRILLKPGSLTPAEFETMKQHTLIGGKILSGTNIPLLETAKEIALTHHEKWDGSGYPYGLAGNAVPECGLIVGIVDFYDALVNDRVYRPALPEERAISIISENGRNQFGKDIFDCFISVLPALRRIREEDEGFYGDLASDQQNQDIGYSCALSPKQLRAS
ncbi:MAG: HD domain-containing phosphohydrolase [Pseudomonadota bacterium]